MLESMLSLTLGELQASQFEVKQPTRPMFGPVETADGYVMVAIASEKTFQGLVTVAGRPEFIRDPRFAAYSDRRDHWGDLMRSRQESLNTLDAQQAKSLAAYRVTSATELRKMLVRLAGEARGIP